MDIQLKLSEVLNINQSLKAIIDDVDVKIDTLLKFKLLGIMKAIETIVDNYEQIRNEKIREYGKETDDGHMYISSEDKEAIKKFNDDLSKIIESEVFVNITKLKACEIFDKGICAEYLVCLYPIIEE